MTMAKTSQTHSRRQPWPSVAALLTACVVTLLSIVRGVGPEVVLIRVVVAAVAVTVVVTVAETLIRWFSQIR